MLKPGRAAAGQDYHNVEPHGVKSRVSFGEVMFRQGSNGGLLAGSHRLERATEASVVAQLDLDEDEDVVFAQVKVEFTVARAVVALHELVAALQEISKRHFLAPRP